MQIIKFSHRRTRGLFAAPLLFLAAVRFAAASPLGSPETVSQADTPAAPPATQSQPAPGNGLNPPSPLPAQTKPGEKSSTAAAPVKPASSASLPPGRAAVPQTDTADIQTDVTVTVATRDPQPVDTTATSTTVLTNDDLKNQNYSRAADALQSVPGLAVVTSGTPGQVTSVFTRGTNSNETLLTIDGRRQAPDFQNFYDLTNLTLDNVDQIEVVRTPASTLQGANAIGGVINLVTLSGRGVTTPEGSVGFEGGSFDTYREFAQSLGSAGNFDYGVAFSRQDSHFPLPNSDYKNTVYRGNFGYIITPKIYFDLQTSYTTSFTGDPGIISFPDPTANFFRETWNISPRITAQVTDFYTTTFYYNRTQLRQVASDPLNFTHNRSQTNTDSIDWQNDFQIARNWKITAGVQGDDSAFTDFDDVAGDEDIDRDISNIGGYAQSQWQPIAGLNILNSVRYDAYSQFQGAFSWRQAASYQTPVTATVLHASVASSYETPTVDDLYSPGFFGFSVGDPNLKPEESLGWEFGADQPFWNHRLDLTATYFHNDLRNLIDDVGPFFDPANIGHATTEGAEIGVTVHPWTEFSANLNYTYLTAKDDETYTRLLRRPRNSLNFTTTYQPIQPVTISLGGSWVVGREDIDAYTDDVEHAKDYFVLRGNVTWQINNTVSVWVRGENLTNASYQPVLGYPALSAAGYGGVKISF
jgi:vitamin B12 transporter